jgi:Na+/H+-dicarboxylate symporter
MAGSAVSLVNAIIAMLLTYITGIIVVWQVDCLIVANRTIINTCCSVVIICCINESCGKDEQI